MTLAFMYLLSPYSHTGIIPQSMMTLLVGKKPFIL